MENQNADERSTEPSSGLKRVIQRRPLCAFFVMAYLFSWIVWIPYVLAIWSVIPTTTFSSLSFCIGTFLGPTLAAFIVTGMTEGDLGLGRLLSRFGIWRVGLGWYLFILLVFPLFAVLGIVVMPGALASFKAPNWGEFLVSYLQQFFVVFFLGGPLAEEPGWRGFALPRLQKIFGPLRATLLLALLWCLWHLPHFLTPAQHGGPGMTINSFFVNLIFFSLSLLAFAIIYTWVFNHTRGSIFIAVLLHTSTNANLLPQLFPAPSVTSTDLFGVIGFGVPALLIVFFTRGRLGYNSTPPPS
jgi:uncharacterized protein